MKSLVIARRELAAYLLAPSSYVVAAVFLAAQGYAFFFFLTLHNQRSAPHHWPAQTFFGGSFLFWLFLFFTAAVLAMRLIAEEKRTGTIEPLLTAPVSAAQVVVGKYLSALAFYSLLWAPTSFYFFWLSRVAPAGFTLDLGPIATGYLGTLLAGASSLALCLLASSTTTHQLLAAVLGFLALVVLLLLGTAGEAATAGGLHDLLAQISLPRHLERFASGIVDTRPFVFHLGLVALALWAAARLLAFPRLGQHRARRVAVELGLLAAVIVAANLLSSRHHRRWDGTREQTHTLAPLTQEILGRIVEPVDVRVIMLPTGADDDVYPQAHRLLSRYRDENPRIRPEMLELDKHADRVRLLAQRYALGGEDLAAGVVVFERQTSDGPRVKIVHRRELAEFALDDAGLPQLRALRAEAAFDGALLDLLEEKPTEVCFSSGHGELRVDSAAVDGMSDWATALRHSHHRPRTLVSLAAGVPHDCQVTVLAGPERPFTANELDALEAYWQRGGRLFILLGPALETNGPGRGDSATATPSASAAGRLRLRTTGLEALLERWGIGVKDALVLDSSLELAAGTLAWAVETGYGGHSISRGFSGRRTIWSLARPLVALSAAGAAVEVVVRTSEAGWGETDARQIAAGRPRFDQDSDERGPLAVALALVADASSDASARLVVFGSHALARNDHDLAFNRDLLVAAVSWLGGRERALGLPPRVPAQLRLSLDASELKRVFSGIVVGLPLVVLLLGCGVWWRRRT